MGRYRRTVSFPNPNPNPTPKTYHVRSVSLPCGRTHPLIPQLRDHIIELRGWVGEGDTNRAGSARLIDSMARLKALLDSLDDVLQLPQTQDSLSFRTDVIEKLLEDFLRFMDAYEVFHGSMLGLKQELSSAQVVARRVDGGNLGPYVKAHKKIAGEVGKLVSAVGSISDQSNGGNKPSVNTRADFHDELGSVINDVHRLTVLLSESVFKDASGLFGPGRRPGWIGLGFGLRKDEEGVEEFGKVLEGVEKLMDLRKKSKNKNNNLNEKNNELAKMGVLKKMNEMEDCVGKMEKESEKVLRSLINNRVSLLNILTHA